MNHRTLLIAIAASGALLLSACAATPTGTTGGSPAGGATTSPAAATAADTPVTSPTEAATAADTAAPTAADTGAAPSGTAALPSLNPHGAPELEAQLPDQIGGSPLTKESYAGAELAAQPSAASFLAVLTEVGAEPTAASFAYGTTQNRDAVGALRVIGADPEQLVQSFVRNTQQQGAAVGQATINGKQVTTVSDVLGFEGQEYVYTTGDTLFFVIAADRALAAEALNALP